MLTTLIYITVTSLFISCASLFVAWLITRRTVRVAADDVNARILSLLSESLAANWSTNAAIENRARDLLDTYSSEGWTTRSWSFSSGCWRSRSGRSRRTSPKRSSICHRRSIHARRPPRSRSSSWRSRTSRWTGSETKTFLSEYGDDDVLERIDEIHDLSSELETSEDPDRRANAAIKLGQIGDASGVPYLVRATQ
ncbi:MAG: HEAT repeat domain-containing protein [Thermomicrobiales bacterium]